jgi:hypothetical protein
VNVAVHNTGTSAGRLLLAAEEIERGNLLAAIPLDMAFSQVAHGGNASMEVGGSYRLTSAGAEAFYQANILQSSSCA